jgi:hypothetical protein
MSKPARKEPDLADLERQTLGQPLTHGQPLGRDQPLTLEPPHFGFGPPLSRLVKCRVEFREGMKIPGLGGGTRRYAPGLYDPDTMVAYVELAGLAGKVVLVSVHCGLITVDRTSGNAPLE